MADDVKIKFGGDSSAVNKELQKTQRQIESLKTKLAKVGSESKKTEKTGKSMGSSMKGQFAGMVKGALTLAAAYAAIQSAIRAVNEERKRGAEGIKTAAMARGSLLQLAGGDMREFERMTRAARRTALGEGMEVPQAQELQFALESLGLSKNRKLFAGMHGIADPKALAEGVGTLQSALSKEETGTARQLLNKLFAASAVSKTTVGQFAPAASMAAQTVSKIGVSDEEFLAALAHLSKASKSAEVAATQIDAFAAIVMKKGLSGKGLIGAGREIEKMGMEETKLLEFFGRKEAFKGFSAMMRLSEDIGKTRGVLGKEQAMGPSGDLISAMLGMRERDPQLKAEKLARQTKIGLQLAEMETKGIEQLEYERSQAFYKMASMRAGEGGLRRWMGSTYMAAKHTIEGETFAEDFGPMSTERIEAVSNLGQAADKLNSAADKMDKSKMNYSVTVPHVGDLKQ